MIPTLILMLFVYKRIDRWANSLEFYNNPFDVKVEVPEVSGAIHEELLDNPEEREYNPSQMESVVKNTLKSVA